MFSEGNISIKPIYSDMQYKYFSPTIYPKFDQEKLFGANLRTNFCFKFGYLDSTRITYSPKLGKSD